ncbi:hypothetical protein WG947_05955 [Pontibacter sp. H259]|uniref:hypothetical protein n=1 Tax=Pontibacter sp. H259 TaxID=3133421 RepID=UPI0030BF00CB
MAVNRILFLLLLVFISLSVLSCKPACPIGPCQVRMVHTHGEGVYRGVPFWRKQNLKYGEQVKHKKDKEGKNKRDKSKNKS